MTRPTHDSGLYRMERQHKKVKNGRYPQSAVPEEHKSSRSLSHPYSVVTHAEASGHATYVSPGTDPRLTPHKPAVG